LREQGRRAVALTLNEFLFTTGSLAQGGCGETVDVFGAEDVDVDAPVQARVEGPVAAKLKAIAQLGQAPLVV